MTKYVVKVEKAGRMFRINIPRKIIATKLWFDVSHVLVEEHRDGYIILRRLFDGEALEGKDSPA